MVDNFGMMDNAYFTSKSDIIKWINNVLKLNIMNMEWILKIKINLNI